MESVDVIKQSSRRIYFTLTGGGSYSLSKLLMSGGASSVFVGANIPYSGTELDDIMSEMYSNHCLELPEYKSASFHVAKELSRFSSRHSNDIGVGVTCSLMKTSERLGREHIVYLSIVDKTRSYHSNMIPNGKCRFEQEVLTGNFILDELAKFIGEREVD